jgi:hypothetical protein
MLEVFHALKCVVCQTLRHHDTNIFIPIFPRIFMSDSLVMFKEASPGVPNFRTRLHLHANEPPTRVYFHESCFRNETFPELARDDKKNATAHGYANREAIRNYVKGVLANASPRSPSAFILAAAWAEGRRRMLDIFSYSGITDWPGNPDVEAFVMQDGVLVPNRPITCGDTLIILGAEEKYRRTTKHIYEYKDIPPKLEDIGLVQETLFGFR